MPGPTGGLVPERGSPPLRLLPHADVALRRLEEGLELGVGATLGVGVGEAVLLTAGSGGWQLAVGLLAAAVLGRLLDRGDLDAWRPLAAAVRAANGETGGAVVEMVRVEGTSPLPAPVTVTLPKFSVPPVGVPEKMPLTVSVLPTSKVTADPTRKLCVRLDENPSMSTPDAGFFWTFFGCWPNALASAAKARSERRNFIG